MKKTLFAILALAGVAIGADKTLADATIYSPKAVTMNLDAEGMEDCKDFTLVMDINANEMMKLLSTSASTSTSTWIATMTTDRSSGGTYSTGLGVVYASGSNKKDASLMAAYTNNGKIAGVNYNVSDGTNKISYLSDIVSSTWGYNSKTNTSDISHAAVSIYGTAGSNYSICLTLKKSDGSILEYTGVTSGYTFSNTTDLDSITFNQDVVKSAYYYDSVLTTSNVQKLNAALVPEPTTATLSLLALAGLAARRRRR